MPPPFPHPLGGFFIQGKTALGVRNADLPDDGRSHTRSSAGGPKERQR